MKYDNDFQFDWTKRINQGSDSMYSSKEYIKIVKKKAKEEEQYFEKKRLKKKQ